LFEAFIRHLEQLEAEQAATAVVESTLAPESGEAT
jgi:hypothetical protein